MRAGGRGLWGGMAGRARRQQQKQEGRSSGRGGGKSSLYAGKRGNQSSRDGEWT